MAPVKGCEGLRWWTERRHSPWHEGGPGVEVLGDVVQD